VSPVGLPPSGVPPVGVSSVPLPVPVPGLPV